MPCRAAACGLILLVGVMVLAQGTPPIDPSQPEQFQAGLRQGTPPIPPATMVQQMTAMLKKEVNKAIDENPYPSLDNWRPLTTREKLQVFLKSTYSLRTFAETGADALEDKVINDNRHYPRGLAGLGEHYGVDLGGSETGVFFVRFLIPTLLRQDPRYFRNPALPTGKRILYSISRVVITRADNGGQTFNASRLFGETAAQAIADLYAPGQPQGLRPIADRAGFDLGSDAGFNLLHEFWPDIRRKFLHR